MFYLTLKKIEKIEILSICIMDIPNKVLEIYNLNPECSDWIYSIGNYKDTWGEDWNRNDYLIYHYLLELNLSKKSRNKKRMFKIKKVKYYADVKINMGIKDFKEFYNQFTLNSLKIIGI